MQSGAIGANTKPHFIFKFLTLDRYKDFQMKAELKMRAEAVRAKMRESHLAGFREEVKQR